MEVTVTGGLGHPPATLDYSAIDRAFVHAEALASVIDASYDTAIYYNPGHPLHVPSYGYLVVPDKYASHNIVATGFGAIVDENNTKSSTIHGGDSDTGQTVLAGAGGLTYSANLGDNTVVAGGGNNRISFNGDTGANVASTSIGNDTVVGGNGQTTISAGSGYNQVFLHSGHSLVQSSGFDTVSLGGGSDTIDVLKGGADVVLNNSRGSGERLTFVGGAGASTVEAGGGSYTIFGATGGGVFHGGSAGDNLIKAGSGAVTLIGGGGGDTLLGGTGSDLIKASTGNETLGGGEGHNVFDVSLHTKPGQAGYGTTDTIKDFTKHDLLDVGGIRAINYALNTYSISGGSGSFLLEDGTKVLLQSDTYPLLLTDFKH